MGGDDGLYDGQPEADSASVAATGRIRTVEAVEDPRQCFGCDADTLVTDHENCSRAGGGDRDVHPSSMLGVCALAVFNRVVHEIHGNLLDAHGIAEDVDAALAFAVEHKTLLFSEQAHVL